jgi:hypothetical protein
LFEGSIQVLNAGEILGQAALVALTLKVKVGISCAGRFESVFYSYFLEFRSLRTSYLSLTLKRYKCCLVGHADGRGYEGDGTRRLLVWPISFKS